jgi:hypothetical protein
MQILKDVNNKTSSKRVAGAIGLFVAIVLTATALFWDETGNAQGLVYAWLSFTGAALGITIAEKKKDI